MFHRLTALTVQEHVIIPHMYVNGQSSTNVIGGHYAHACWNAEGLHFGAFHNYFVAHGQVCYKYCMVLDL